jgi:hypothetical protein
MDKKDVVQQRQTLNDSLKGRFSQMFPEETFDSEESLMSGYDRFSKDYDDLKGYKTANEEGSRRFAELLEVEPVLAEVIKDVMSGASLIVALRKHFDPEDFEMSEDDANYEDYSKTISDRKEKIEASKNRDKTLKDNTLNSIKEIESFTKTNFGEDKDGADKFLEWIDTEVFSSIANNKISQVLLTKLYQAYTHEEKQKEYEEIGELKGQNKKIQAQKVKPGAKTDGLPDLSSSKSGNTKPHRSHLRDVLDAD